MSISANRADIVVYDVVKVTNKHDSSGWGCLALLVGFAICLALPFAIGKSISVALVIAILLGIFLVLAFISFAASEFEGAWEQVQLRKEERERERARYLLPLQAALRSRNPQLQATALSAVQEYGYTQAALEQVYQDYTFDQLLAGAEREEIDLEKPE